MAVETPKKQLLIDRDLLQLRITSAKDGYVSVWVESPGDTVDALLFNTPHLIKAGEPMDLPDISEPLLANGPTGKNRILVIVSDNKIDQTMPATLDARNLSSIQFGAATVEIEQVEQSTR